MRLILATSRRPSPGIPNATAVIALTITLSLLALTPGDPFLTTHAQAASAPQGPAEVQVVPDAPVQGDTLAVLVTSSGRARVTVEWDGTTVPAFEVPGGPLRALIGTDPDLASGTHTVRVTLRAGDGTAKRIARTLRLLPGQFGVRQLTLPPKTLGLITTKNLAVEQQALAPVFRRRTPVAYWQGPFQAPSTGAMDSPYGEQSFYNGRRAWWHGGMDYQAPAGDPVTAANAGIVALARALPLGGNTVVIDHGQGVFTEYLHLSAFAVRVGDRAEKGAVIGRIGATGLVTGPSLHWGLYVLGIPVNPLFWMEPRSGLTS